MTRSQVNRQPKARDVLSPPWERQRNGHQPAEPETDLPLQFQREGAPSFGSVFETNRQGLLGIDLQGRCTLLNQAAAEMLGLKPQEAVGQKLHQAIRLRRPDGSSCSADQFPTQLAFQNGRAGRPERGLLWRSDGTSFPAEYASFAVIEDGVIQGIVMTFANALERDRLEQQVRQAQKMETIGRLTGGIAHDFNNLLTAILGYSELMRDGISNCDPLYHEIVEINKAAQRAVSLTSQLMNFSRKQAVTPRFLDLNVLLADMEGMLRRLLGEDVELSLALDPSLGWIKADQGQIEQVVLNLAVNARDAMPCGGRLTITTANGELGKNGGEAVILSVTDTGSGMDDQTKARIFEPFFTTKAPGQGTGLGLATVLDIVKENDGFIDVTSCPGEGAVFTVYFPRLQQTPEAVRATSPQAVVVGGTETVLLVEDEETLRDLVQSILSRYGYHVLKASNAVEALRIGQCHPEPIHLLLTDLIMPQMSGRQLADQLAPVRPNMKILYMLGSTGDTVARHGLSQLDIVTVRKPFTPSVLARRVREVLDEGKREWPSNP